MTTFLSPQAILDFENELDVNMLDRVIETFYTGAGTEVCRLTATHQYITACCVHEHVTCKIFFFITEHLFCVMQHLSDS